MTLHVLITLHSGFCPLRPLTEARVPSGVSILPSLLDFLHRQTGYEALHSHSYVNRLIPALPENVGAIHTDGTTAKNETLESVRVSDLSWHIIFGKELKFSAIQIARCLIVGLPLRITLSFGQCFIMLSCKALRTEQAVQP